MKINSKNHHICVKFLNDGGKIFNYKSPTETSHPPTYLDIDITVVFDKDLNAGSMLLVHCHMEG